MRWGLCLRRSKCSRRFSGLVCWLPTPRPVALPELLWLPDVFAACWSQVGTQECERSRPTPRKRADSGCGPGPRRSLAADRACPGSDFAPGGVLGGLNYLQEVASASCPLVDGLGDFCRFDRCETVDTSPDRASRVMARSSRSNAPSSVTSPRASSVSSSASEQAGSPPASGTLGARS
jgi:hypothetical protein